MLGLSRAVKALDGITCGIGPSSKITAPSPILKANRSNSSTRSVSRINCGPPLVGLPGWTGKRCATKPLTKGTGLERRATAKEGHSHGKPTTTVGWCC
jgi:hypothetical protein